jgi:hypothetical protein
MDSQQAKPISDATVQERTIPYAAGLTGLVSAQDVLIDGCHAVSTEMLAFWQSRLKESMATGQRLLECDSPERALEVQLEYVKAALQAYVDESAKLGDLLSRSLARMGQSSRSAVAPTVPAALAA